MRVGSKLFGAGSRVPERLRPGGTSRRLLRGVIALGLFEVAFFVAYRYAMSFSQAIASPFWFPDSILLCALLVARPRWWPLVVLAPLPIRLFSSVSADLPLWFLLATYAIDSAKGLLAAALLRRFLRNPLRLQTVPEFGRYGLIAVLLVPALGALAGATARHLLGNDFWHTWVQWFSGNALAHLVITPAILYWFVGAPWRGVSFSAGRWAEATLLAVGLIVTSYLSFAGDANAPNLALSRVYMPIPFLVWAAVRFGMPGATGGVAIIAVMAVAAALTGRAPFAGKSPADAALALQEFLFVRAVPFLLLAILFDQMYRTEQFLRESEQRYRDVVDAQSDLVCRFLPDTTLTFVNAAYCKYFGKAQEDLIGTRFLNLLPESTRTLVLKRVEAAAEQRIPCESEHEVELPGGGRGWQHWTDYPIVDAGGRLTEFQGIGRDITERKRTEEASQNLAHVSRLAMAGEMTAMIAHEVTQPLSAILSNAEAAARLLQADEPPLYELQEIIGDIRRNDLRASEVVSHIRRLARKRSIHLQPLDINDAITDVLRFAGGDAIHRQVRVVSQLHAELPWALGDRVHLQQVLLNLLVNAMDSMKEVDAADRQVTIQTRLCSKLGRRFVEVTVRDCGRGIATHQISQIFQSFFTTKPDGMGMGLAIARSIIQAHRGQIWAENGPLGGAIFRFAVPVAEDEVPERVNERSPATSR